MFIRAYSNSTYFITQVVSLFPPHDKLCSILYTSFCDRIYQWLVAGQWLSPGTRRFTSSNETPPLRYYGYIVESDVKHL